MIVTTKPTLRAAHLFVLAGTPSSTGAGGTIGTVTLLLPTIPTPLSALSSSVLARVHLDEMAHEMTRIWIRTGIVRNRPGLGR
ncbi:uncharacterized protein BDV17DRAFT_152560 [Aspergillus undulatus]|uniref:uncharacterized protein n=1 Tax=Aspergillus undulatus TaxID=1810928 RepID=UPI003CCDD742